MALTATEKYTVISYLGWPIQTLTEGNTSYAKGVADRLDGFPEGAEVLLRALLVRIALVDDQLDKMNSRSNLKRFDDIEFFEDGSFDLRRERGSLVRELAIMLDIRILSGGGMGNVSI